MQKPVLYRFENLGGNLHIRVFVDEKSALLTQDKPYHAPHTFATNHATGERLFFQSRGHDLLLYRYLLSAANVLPEGRDCVILNLKQIDADCGVFHRDLVKARMDSMGLPYKHLPFISPLEEDARFRNWSQDLSTISVTVHLNVSHESNALRVAPVAPKRMMYPVSLYCRALVLSVAGLEPFPARVYMCVDDSKMPFSLVWEWHDETLLWYLMNPIRSQNTHPTLRDINHHRHLASGIIERVPQVQHAPLSNKALPGAVSLSQKCGICLDSHMTNVCLYPCGCAKMCAECTETVMLKPGAVCPFCRRKIEGKTVYVTDACNLNLLAQEITSQEAAF